MSRFSALNAADVLDLLLGWLSPFLEASGFFVPILSAFGTGYDVGLSAFASLVSWFVAFETYFLIAVE